MRHIESNIQKACVSWFDLQYSHLSKCLIAVPNGGNRNAREAAIMKAEGIRAGAADLILLAARGQYGALCIEMKTATGRQSPAQKEWQKQAENAGNKYVVCRSIGEFMNVVNDYLVCGK